MDFTGIASLVTAIVAVITALVGGLTAAWKLAKAQAKAELTAEESEKALASKDKEIDRLWRLLDTLTHPEGGT